MLTIDILASSSCVPGERVSKVIQIHSKTPHAWLKGRIIEVFDGQDYERHHRTLARMTAAGSYLAYDPYKTKTFRYYDRFYLPTAEEAALIPEGSTPGDIVSEVYCYESGIIGRNR